MATVATVRQNEKGNWAVRIRTPWWVSDRDFGRDELAARRYAADPAAQYAYFEKRLRNARTKRAQALRDRRG